MSMSAGGSKKGVNAEINMTPLIDIVLVLLIIFMVMVPQMLRELNANVPPKPDDKTPPPPPGTEQYTIETLVNGTYKLNSMVVSETEMLEKLRTAMAPKQERNRVVFFKSDDDAPYGRVVKAMDIARGAGAKTLGVASPTP